MIMPMPAYMVQMPNTVMEIYKLAAKMKEHI
jgi:hypothetical protein